MISDLHWLSIDDASKLIAKRQLSPVDYLKALHDRSQALQPQLAAFTQEFWVEAEASARKAEEDIVRSGPRSPLHGIPIGLKDIIDIAGHPTTCHSKILLDNQKTADSATTERLRAAGAIFPGKMSTHEFALGGPAFDLPFPPARNPWNPDHHPGGSSSGSGVAVAGGILPGAIGTDTGGSIRHPAFACGLAGMKPTYGLVSRYGVFPLAFSLDHIGPLTRTITDNALLLNALAGYDQRDPASANQPAEDYTRDLNAGLKGLRIGFVRHFHETDMPAPLETITALDEAANVFRREGAYVIDVRLPDLTLLAATNRVILLSEAVAIHETWLKERPGDYSHNTRQRLLPGIFLNAADYIQAQRSRRRLVDEINNTFRSVDVLLVASSMEPACRIDDDAELSRTYPRQARAPFNLSGHPALAVMCGLSADKLPLGFQLVGPAFSEALLYRAARGYERATPWHTIHPDI